MPRYFRPTIAVLSALLLALAFGAVRAPTAAAGAAAADDAITMEEAYGRKDALAAALRSSSATNDDLLAALDAVEEAYASAGTDARKRDAFRRAVDKLLVKALLHWKHAPGESANQHEPSCIRAAEILGRVAAHLDHKARRALSARVRTAIEKLLDAHKPDEISQAQLDASFAAVGHLGDPGSLAWYQKNFMHTKLVDLRSLAAAHKSLVLFRDVPGRIRHDVVKTLIQRYVGEEAQAEQGNTVSERAAKRFWDEMKIYTIPALQYLAGKPTDANGVALATMATFQAWWRDHKRTRDGAWRDD